MTMGDRIKKRRQELRLSQQELSNLAGVRRATISDIESGKQPGMSVDTARRLARALGVSIDYLVGTWDNEGSESVAALAL